MCTVPKCLFVSSVAGAEIFTEASLNNVSFITSVSCAGVCVTNFRFYVLKNAYA